MRRDVLAPWGNATDKIPPLRVEKLGTVKVVGLLMVSNIVQSKTYNVLHWPVLRVDQNIVVCISCLENGHADAWQNTLWYRRRHLILVNHLRAYNVKN